MEGAQPGTGTETGKNGRKAVGRRDGQGNEKTVKIPPLKAGVKECMTLFMRAEAARVRYKDACKATAERGGIESSTLNKLIKSSAKGRFEETKSDIDQQALIFDQVGEVEGGKPSDHDD